MSLSPFDSFQSRFVTYLLNFPRIKEGNNIFAFVLSVEVVCQQDTDRINKILHQINVSRKSTYQIAKRSKEDCKTCSKIKQFHTISGDPWKKSYRGTT